MLTAHFFSQLRLDFDEKGTLYAPPHGGIQYVGEPTDAMDDAWKDLIHVDAVDLIGSEADTVRDTTLKKDSGHSIVGIDGFHQIHCLNMLRKAVRSDKYPMGDPEPIYRVHLDHCIDYLRQILMCNIDITPQMVSWSDVANRPLTNFEAVYTCRNFQKVKAWVAKHSAHKHPLPFFPGRPRPSKGWVDLHTGEHKGH